MEPAFPASISNHFPIHPPPLFCGTFATPRIFGNAAPIKGLDRNTHPP